MQPFAAKVCAIRADGWTGHNLFPEGIDDPNRIYRVDIGYQITHKELDIKGKEIENEDKLKRDGWHFISPSIPVDRFCWSSGVFRIGQSFGTEDYVRKKRTHENDEK